MWLRKLLERQIRILRSLYLKVLFIRRTQNNTPQATTCGAFSFISFSLTKLRLFFQLCKGQFPRLWSRQGGLKQQGSKS